MSAICLAFGLYWKEAKRLKAERILESEVFTLDIMYRYVGHLHGLRLRLEEGKVVKGREDPEK